MNPVIDAEFDPRDGTLRLGINMDRVYIPVDNLFLAEEIVRFLKVAGCKIEFNVLGKGTPKGKRR